MGRFPTESAAVGRGLGLQQCMSSLA